MSQKVESGLRYEKRLEEIYRERGQGLKLYGHDVENFTREAILGALVQSIEQRREETARHSSDLELLGDLRDTRELRRKPESSIPSSVAPEFPEFVDRSQPDALSALDDAIELLEGFQTRVNNFLRGVGRSK